MVRYRIGEFAALTGVSVRTLHHYDRIALLEPSQRTEVGYRSYSDEDMLRLQQILTLRYLGFPLRRIKDLLDAPDFDLMASLGIQRMALRDQMVRLTRIEEALDTLLQQRRSSGRWDWGLAARASKAVQEGLKAKGDSMNDYYTPEQLAEQFTELGKEIGPDERHRIEEEWSRLLEEVHQNHDLDPSTPQAQALLERWDNLVAATFRGHDQLASSVAHGYHQGRYADIEGAPTPQDFAWLQRVREAHTR